MCSYTIRLACIHDVSGIVVRVNFYACMYVNEVRLVKKKTAKTKIKQRCLNRSYRSIIPLKTINNNELFVFIMILFVARAMAIAEWTEYANFFSCSKLECIWLEYVCRLPLFNTFFLDTYVLWEWNNDVCVRSVGTISLTILFACARMRSFSVASIAN